MSVATATAVDKVHAVSDGASASSSRSISSVSSSDMTAVVVDTARPKGGRGVIVLAQPLCRSFQGLHIKDGRPREKEQERGQDTATHERPTRSASLRQNPCDESSSTSSASASMVATEGSLDKFLLTALQNRQDRLFLLKLEREYCNFIEDPSEDVLEFPWLNSYYRMMIHRSAIYFQLARKVDANQKKITLSKTEHSAM
ncbi:R3H domain-containing protein 1 [Mortierella sp. AD031]|nr:R3H domain-containing protein 1 [Mortierella sp. AD031]